MKSEKVTSTSRGRWYDDACGTALALEFVGERWSLLILRELMFGPRRFGEIRAHLPGISANVLTQRLAGLAEVGALVRRRLPSSATVQVYELTPWGLEAEPILQEMGRWATRSARHDPTLYLSPASAMMSLRTMIDRAGARGMAMTVAFRFPDDAFVATIADGGIVIHRGEDVAADVAFTTDPSTLAAVVYGKVPVADLEQAGMLSLTGDRVGAARFIDLFHLPPHIAG